MLELKAKIREILGKKIKSLRSKGILPAVVYGTKAKSVPLELNYNEFEKVYKEAGESTIIKLGLGKEEKNVLIHNVARDPVTDQFIHIDFFQVRMDKPITAEVPLVFEGVSPAVDVEKGVLVKNINKVEVEALPLNLPPEIKVDISILKNFEDSINIKDLKVSAEVKILAEPEEVVASVVPPRSEEELAELEEKPEEAEELEKVEEGEGEEVKKEETKEETKEEKIEEEK